MVQPNLTVTPELVRADVSLLRFLGVRDELRFLPHSFIDGIRLPEMTPNITTKYMEGQMGLSFGISFRGVFGATALQATVYEEGSIELNQNVRLRPDDFSSSFDTREIIDIDGTPVHIGITHYEGEELEEKYALLHRKVCALAALANVWYPWEGGV